MEASLERWSKPVAVMHWVTVLLLLAIVSAGLTMTSLDATDPLRRNLGRVHTISGNLLGLLTLVRLITIRRGTRPAELEMAPLHRRGVGVVHALLYLVTFGVIASGLATGLRTTWHEYLKGDLPTPPVFDALTSRSVHEVLAYSLVAFVAAHVVGVFVHEVRKGGALRRMLPFLR